MLTRFVRTQLVIFAIASVIGVAVMLFTYMQVPTLLGIGRVTVKLQLPEAGGLYRFSNVTYNGVQMGTVTDVKLTENGAEATMSLARSPKVPADLVAEVRSVSAVGEQYVDLRPKTDSGPFLENGSVIPADRTVIPQQVGPMLDNLSAMVNSIPGDRLSDLLDETYQAFDGAGFDFQSLMDSATRLSTDANSVADEFRTMVDDSVPLMNSQAQSTDAIRTWSRSLAGITEQVVINDPQLRSVLSQGPGFADEVSALLNDIQPTLPLLLANMNTVGQILMTYNPSIEQLMVLLPAYIGSQQTFGIVQLNATGWPQGDFTLTISDPNPCMVGFLPPSQWRSPADTTTIDSPDGLYCKLPQDSPIAVRGARNFPCIEHPGKRAPTVELCDDPRGFVPLAMRQHLTGPMPIDPSLLAQGIPVDDRVEIDDRTFTNVEGTPLPPGAQRAGTPPVSPPDAPTFPVGPPAPGAEPAAPSAPYIPPPPPGNSVNGVPVAPVTPNSFAPSANSGPAGAGPSVAVLPYDPNTGKYMSTTGRLEQQTNVIAGSETKSWKDLMPT